MVNINIRFHTGRELRSLGSKSSVWTLLLVVRRRLTLFSLSHLQLNIQEKNLMQMTLNDTQKANKCVLMTRKLT